MLRLSLQGKGWWEHRTEQEGQNQRLQGTWLPPEQCKTELPSVRVAMLLFHFSPVYQS